MLSYADYIVILNNGKDVNTIAQKTNDTLNITILD